MAEEEEEFEMELGQKNNEKLGEIYKNVKEIILNTCICLREIHHNYPSMG